MLLDNTAIRIEDTARQILFLAHERESRRDSAGAALERA